MPELQPLEDEEPQDEYRGGEGWLVVAVGERGRACYLDVDPGFGALRYWIYEAGLDDPEEMGGVHPPEDAGVYRATAKCWTHTSHEGEHDMGFNLTSDWEEVSWPLPEAADA